MYPFIDPVLLRLDNRGDRPVKIGYQIIRAGTYGDVPVGTVHAPALKAAREAGVVFVGFVINDQLYDLVPIDMPVPVVEEVPVVVEVPVVEVPVVVEVPKTFVSSDDFLESSTKEQVTAALDELGLEEVVDYSSMKKPELVELVEKKGLDATGLFKKDLIELLNAD